MVVGMYVPARSRRKGIGRELLTACIAQAKSWQGVELIHLTVSEVAIEARALYEKFGFTAWGQETNALKFNDRYADEFHMVLRISP